MDIIAFCGYPKAGKDEALNYLKEKYGFVKESFGEGIREEVRRALVDPEVMYESWYSVTTECRDAIKNCLSRGDMNPWSKPTSPAMRTLLQQWGTEYRRGLFGDQYWVDSARHRMNYKGPHARIGFTDVRHPLEYEYVIGELGGKLYRIDNYRAEVHHEHDSEKHWPHFVTSGVINNHGTIEQLHAQLDTIMASYPDVVDG